METCRGHGRLLGCCAEFGSGSSSLHLVVVDLGRRQPYHSQLQSCLNLHLPTATYNFLAIQEACSAYYRTCFGELLPCCFETHCCLSRASTADSERRSLLCSDCTFGCSDLWSCSTSLSVQVSGASLFGQSLHRRGSLCSFRMVTHRYFLLGSQNLLVPGL